MKSILRRRPSPALVISCIALFVSLGGVSYGVATGFIDSREIKNNSVRSADIRNSNVEGRDVASNTLKGADISEQDLGKVPSASVADAATSATSAGTAGVRGVGGRRDAQDLQLAGPARRQLTSRSSTWAGSRSRRAAKTTAVVRPFKCRPSQRSRTPRFRRRGVSGPAEDLATGVPAHARQPARATGLGRSPTPAPTARS